VVKLWASEFNLPEMGIWDRCYELFVKLNGSLKYNETLADALPYSQETASATLLRREGVCRHFARAYAAILLDMDVPVRTVIGTVFIGSGTYKKNHEWDEAYIPGLGWVAVDVAWNTFAKLPSDHIQYTIWSYEGESLNISRLSIPILDNYSSLVINRLEEICFQNLEKVKGLLGAGIFIDELEKVPFLLARARDEVVHGSTHSALLFLAEARILVNNVENQIHLMYYYVVVFVICFSLLILGSKLKEKPVAQNMLYTAFFSLFFIAIVSAFISDIVLIIFLSLWIIPFGIASNLEQKHPISYKLLINIGGLWFISFCLFLIYQYMMLTLLFPSLLLPLVIFLLSLFFIYRFNKSVFAPSKRFNLEDFHKLFSSMKRLKKRVYMSLLIPICLTLLIFLISKYIHLAVSTQVLQVLYSMICGILSTLLGITVSLTTLLISVSQLSNEIKALLIRSIKELCLLYGFTIIVSLVGLIFLPLSSINLHVFATELEIILQQTIFFATVGLFGACLSSLTAVFFEIVDEIEKEKR
jgi:hypothetical protein